MGDPGLKSKFVTMQQEEKFAATRPVQAVDNYTLAIQLDIARVKEQLSRAKNRKYRQMLSHALADLIAQLK